MNSRFYYMLAMAGYFALFTLLMTWTLWVSPPTIAPVSIVLLIYIGPLLFPLRGLLNRKLYTFGWTQFMALFYLMMGIVVTASNLEERRLGILQITFSLMLFIGGMFYIKYSAKEADAHRKERGNT